MQFQRRGTPHCHGLIAVKHDGISADDIVSMRESAVENVKSEIKRVITAKLVSNQINSDWSCDADLSYDSRINY